MQFNPASASLQSIMAILAAMACGVSRTPQRVLGYFISWPLFAAVLLNATISLPMLVFSYIAPCGAIQDTVAAGELLAGRTAYPPDMRPVVKRIVHDNPVPSTVSWLKGVQAAHLGCMYDLRLNAHPPLVAVGLEPVVAVLGYYKPIILFQTINLVSIILMILLWSKAFELMLGPKEYLFYFLVLLGSEPFFGVLRSAGMSALLAMLVVAVWYLLRREWNGWAGIVLAVATGLKLFPVVAAGSMLFGRMKALFTLMLTSLGIVLGIVFLHGTQIFSEFSATAHSDVSFYDWMRGNYSLYANIRYLLKGDDSLLIPLTVLIYGSLCVVAGIAVFRLRNSRALCCDFGMAIAATLMCLFPPIVWVHYFVILFLPLCIISRYSKWWASRGASITFLLTLASVDGEPLEKLSALGGIEVLASLPTLGVLVMLGWLCVKAFQLSASSIFESGQVVARH
jgi:hypothetical protein